VYRPNLRLFQLATPILVVVAMVGYLVGHRHSAATPARDAYGASVLLEYPTGWQPAPASAAPAIPGLPLTGPLLLTPGPNASQVGLLSGQIAASPTSQFPSAFLARLHGTPHTEVLELLHTQSYRYSQLNLNGYAPTLELYEIPTPGSKHTVLACYATSNYSAYMRRCMQIVAGLSLVGEAPSDLVPEAGYASPLDHLIATLNTARATLRRQMRAGIRAASMSNLARSLAANYAAAITSLAALEPPAPVSATQAALTIAMIRAQHGYDELAGAALAGDRGAYASAQAQIDAAESSVNAALQSFALLGYGEA
jgi:hypothetical protein